MQLDELGIQIVLKSEKAFNSLKYIKSDVAPSKEYYIKRVSRDKKAREMYFNNYRKEVISEGLFVVDIIRKEYKNGDKIV